MSSIESFIGIYIPVALGVIISVILPIIRKMIPGQQVGPAGVRGFLSRFWPMAKPYVLLGIFSLLVGLLIVAFVGDTLTDWRVALVGGYAWDSTLQKIKG